MYTVLIADDQKIFRDMTRNMLSSVDFFEVIADATDGEDAVELYAELRPDLVVMDVQMERMDGLQASRRIIRGDSRANVLLTSISDDAAYARLGEELGVMAFVPKHRFRPDAIKAMLDERCGMAIPEDRAA